MLNMTQNVLKLELFNTIARDNIIIQADLLILIFGGKYPHGRVASADLGIIASVILCDSL